MNNYEIINNRLADSYDFVKKWVMVIVNYWTKESIEEMKI